MNIPKKIVAVLSALLIVLKILLVNASAAFSPVLSGVGIIELLIALLSGAGYSSSELQGKSYSELNDLLGESINNGSINRNTVLYNPVLQKEQTIVDFLQSPEVQAGQKEASAVIDIAFTGWLKNALLQDLLNPPLLENVDTYVKPTLKGDIDIQGFGALVLIPGGSKRDILDYCQYVVISSDGSTFTEFAPRRRDYRYFDGNYNTGSVINISTTMSMSNDYHFYGDIRYEDGTKAPTADEYEYTLGETEDGTKVTVDMLNPDGTVTIDGVTYAPSDYIDLDKFTDTAVDDLIKEINITINNINVAAPDDTKDIFDEISGDIELEISSSLMDYTVPKAIATVFPFCLPFDFVRGMKLMFEKPKVPVFKTELDFTNICGFNLGKHQIEISLEKWEPAAVICRWFFLLMFGFTLIFITPKITKGAGA